jgi:hypothetical protein
LASARRLPHEAALFAGTVVRVSDVVDSALPSRWKCLPIFALWLFQNLVHDERVRLVQASRQRCLVALAGPDALDGVDDAPATLFQLVEGSLYGCPGLRMAVRSGVYAIDAPQANR